MRLRFDLHFFLVMIVAWLAPTASATELVPLFTQYPDPPFGLAQSDNRTSELAIRLTHLSQGKYQFKATYLPRRQLNNVIKKKNWNGVVAWANPPWFDDPSMKLFTWSIPFMRDTDLVLSNKSHAIEYEQDGLSLQGLRMGAIAGHQYTDVGGLISKKKLTRVFRNSLTEQLNLLARSQVDVVFAQASDLNQARKLNPEIDEWLHIAKRPRGTYQRYLFTDKNRPELISFINEAIRQIRSDASWEALSDQSPTHLRLVTVGRKSPRPILGSLRKALDVAFSGAGLTYSLTEEPAERALLNLNRGLWDGDANRQEVFGKFAPNAVMIRPHVSIATVFAISASPDVRPKSYAELVNYRIAIPFGYKGIDEMTKIARKRDKVTTFESCVEMAMLKRVDACILLSDHNTDWTLKGKYGDQAYATVIERIKVYVWLDSSMKAQADSLSHSLQYMEENGDLARIMGPFRSQ
jgi:hypothetical protein